MRQIELACYDQVVWVPDIANLLPVPVVTERHGCLVNDSGGPRPETQIKDARYAVDVRCDDADYLVAEAEEDGSGCGRGQPVLEVRGTRFRIHAEMSVD